MELQFHFEIQMVILNPLQEIIALIYFFYNKFLR